MFKMKRVNALVGVMVYPDGKMREGYEEADNYDFAAFLSTMIVNAIFCTPFAGLADSGACLKITQTGNREEEGMLELTQCAKVLALTIRDNIPYMTGENQYFYKKLLTDFTENGFSMPFYEELISPEEAKKLIEQEPCTN